MIRLTLKGFTCQVIGNANAIGEEIDTTFLVSPTNQILVLEDFSCGLLSQPEVGFEDSDRGRDENLGRRCMLQYVRGRVHVSRPYWHPTSILADWGKVSSQFSHVFGSY